MPDILATTSIEETWGKSERIIFLGEWCKIYSRKDTYENRDHITLKYHWSDKKKMDRDKINIEDMYEKKLKILIRKLNEIHKINKDDRYWRIILGPWLYSYISTIYERWETINSFFESNLYSANTLFYHLKKNEKKNYDFTTDSLRDIFYQDIWNQEIFGEIIKYNYSNKLNIEEKDCNLKKYYRNQNYKLYEDSKIKYVLKNILKFLNVKFAKILINKNKVLFDEPFMSIPKFVKLNLNINCYPCSSKNFFIKDEIKLKTLKKFDKNLRKKLNINTTDHFQSFLDKKIIDDMPQIFLEKFTFARQLIEKYLSDEKKIIFSNVNIYHNDLYKIWAAEMCSKQSKLLINHHGGGIPYKYVFFEHDRKIADKIISWNKSNHKNEIQMTPLKILGKSENFSSNKKNLLMFSTELPRYSFRVQSIPIGDEILKNFERLISLTEKLDKNILNFTKLRMANNFEWYLSKRFSDKFGSQTILGTKNSIYEDFKSCRLTLHNNPSTPFIESLNLNLPSILFFDKNSWRFESDYTELVNDLMQKKLLFENENEAAKHINLIWNNIDEWWFSNEIQNLRQEFLKNFCYVKKNWAEEYKKFFNQIYGNSYQ